MLQYELEMRGFKLLNCNSLMVLYEINLQYVVLPRENKGEKSAIKEWIGACMWVHAVCVMSWIFDLSTTEA